MARHLDIVGLGIGGVGNLTLMANQLIASAERIFFLVPDDSSFEAYLAALAKESIDLSGYYARGATSSQVYDSITERILRDDAPWEKGVLVMNGNPQLYDTIVRRVRRAAAQAGWTTALWPAISSLDTIMIDLDLQVEEGLLVLDAGRMLLWNIPVEIGVGCLLLQLAACTIGHFVAVEEQVPESFHPLRDWLVKFYGREDHPFTIIRSSPRVDVPAMRIDTCIGGFPAFAKQIDYNCSGYLPPYPGVLRLNRDFAKMLRKH